MFLAPSLSFDDRMRHIFQTTVIWMAHSICSHLSFAPLVCLSLFYTTSSSSSTSFSPESPLVFLLMRNESKSNYSLGFRSHFPPIREAVSRCLSFGFAGISYFIPELERRFFKLNHRLIVSPFDFCFHIAIHPLFIFAHAANHSIFDVSASMKWFEHETENGFRLPINKFSHVGARSTHKCKALLWSGERDAISKWYTLQRCIERKTCSGQKAVYMNEPKKREKGERKKNSRSVSIASWNIQFTCIRWVAGK